MLGVESVGFCVLAWAMSCFRLNFLTFTARCVVATTVLAVLISGCAYKFGYQQRDLPGGFKELAVPVFSNATQQVGIEGAFTNALVRQFARSRVAKVTTAEAAPVFVRGRIMSVDYIATSQVDANREEENIKFNLPENTALTVAYRVLLKTRVELVRQSDQKVLWSSIFDNERVYTAPQVGLAVINSVNPLYNQSARLEVIEQMAHDMMADAHDRMTENF